MLAGIKKFFIFLILLIVISLSFISPGYAKESKDSLPILKEDTLYFISDILGESRLYAIDASTGKRLWASKKHHQMIFSATDHQYWASIETDPWLELPCLVESKLLQDKLYLAFMKGKIYIIDEEQELEFQELLNNKIQEAEELEVLQIQKQKIKNNKSISSTVKEAKLKEFVQHIELHQGKLTDLNSQLKELSKKNFEFDSPVIAVLVSADQMYLGLKDKRLFTINLNDFEIKEASAISIPLPSIVTTLPAEDKIVVSLKEAKINAFTATAFAEVDHHEKKRKEIEGKINRLQEEISQQEKQLGAYNFLKKKLNKIIQELKFTQLDLQKIEKQLIKDIPLRQKEELKQRKEDIEHVIVNLNTQKKQLQTQLEESRLNLQQKKAMKREIKRKKREIKSLKYALLNIDKGIDQLASWKIQLCSFNLEKMRFTSENVKSLLLAGENLYLLTEKEKIYGLNLKEGKTLWALDLMPWFNPFRYNIFIGVILLASFIIWFIYHAQKGKMLFVRRIAGLSALDDAVGRATEMGKPVLFVPGILDVDDIQTLAGLSILSHVAKKTAEYDTSLLVPCSRSVVMSTAQEVVKEAHLKVGRPDTYKKENIRYLTDDQFGFAAGVDGIMLRERPAANFFMGAFYAESLILAETGHSTGAIQLAGTAMPSQLPFFIAACDYTLIGEELFAASAYLSQDPHQIGSLKGQDLGKVIILIFIALGVLSQTFSLYYPILERFTNILFTVK